MFFGRKRVTESDAEVIVLRVSLIAHSKEQSTKQVLSSEQIQSMLEDELRSAKLKGNSQDKNFIRMGVQAVLTEKNFIEGITASISSGLDADLPQDWRRQMRAAVEASVCAFMNQDRTVHVGLHNTR